MMAKLTSEAVASIHKACCRGAQFLREDELNLPGDEQIVEIDGIVHRLYYSQGALGDHATEIVELLAELPREFQPPPDGGGGWTFLNACQDREGNEWTDLHLRMEQLVCLGIAIGRATWMMKEYADALLGGVPYFGVLAAPAEEAAK